MQKEELLRKRLLELSKIASYRNFITYTDFLNLNELNISIRCRKMYCIHRTELLAAMLLHSVRLQHFFLMLFVYVQKRRICHILWGSSISCRAAGSFQSSCLTEIIWVRF